MEDYKLSDLRASHTLGWSFFSFARLLVNFLLNFSHPKIRDKKVQHIKRRSSRLNLMRREGMSTWRAAGAVPAPKAPVYRWQRFHQTVLRIFPHHSVALR